MGFGFPAWIGVRASYLVTAATSALAGVLALWIGDEVAPAPPTSFPPVASPLRVRLVAACAGFLGIGLEVLWVKLFAQVLHNSVYSFTAVSLTGAVAGAIVTAFVAIPTVGVRPTFLLAAVAYVALADAITGTVSTLRPLGYLALLIIVALDPFRAPLTHLASGETLRD